MSIFRNLPTEQAEDLAGLITVRENQVVSMALTKGSGPSMTLLAFDSGENVSEEQYFGDTLYLLAEGEAAICKGEETIPLKAGQVLMVPAHTLHSVEGKGAFKILQLTLQEGKDE